LYDATSGEPHRKLPYFLRLASGVVYHGTTDDNGHTEVAHSNAAETMKIFVGHDALREIAKLGGTHG
jgi:hypothetical protein